MRMCIYTCVCILADFEILISFICRALRYRDSDKISTAEERRGSYEGLDDHETAAR